MDITSYILGKKAGGGSAPTGTIEITENGTTNVSNYAYADVDVQPDLEAKNITITENTTTTITPTSGKDGLSSVEITTDVQSGGYQPLYGMTINMTNSIIYDTQNKAQAELDNILNYISQDKIFSIRVGLSAIRTFDLSNLTGIGIRNLREAFAGNINMTTLDLKNLNNYNSQIKDAISCFYNCTSLTLLDMRNFDFTPLTLSGSMFGNNASSGPPNNCLIIVKDATQKQWLNTNFSRLTNVKTVAEYEGS